MYLCVVDNLSIIGVLLDEKHILCQVPARRGTASTSITVTCVNSSHLDALNQINLEYYENFVVERMEPFYGPEEGGNLVDLLLSKPILRNIGTALSIFCKFPSMIIPADHVDYDLNIVKCRPEASYLKANESLSFIPEISINGQDFHSVEMNYTVIKTPSIESIYPSDIVENVLTTLIIGIDLGSSIERFLPWSCKLGNKVFPAMLIASDELHCEVAISNPGIYSFSLTYNKVDWMFSNYFVQVYSELYITSIIPTIVPHIGGSEITITGFKFDTIPSVCFVEIESMTTSFSQILEGFTSSDTNISFVFPS
jgi:hypothetical protein